jgi:hypothetical protein
MFGRIGCEGGRWVELVQYSATDSGFSSVLKISVLLACFSRGDYLELKSQVKGEKVKLSL